MKELQRLEASVPVLCSLSFYGMKDVELGLSERDRFFREDDLHPYNRDVLRLPETIIQDYTAEHEYGSIVKDQMDLIWNAFGLAKCQYLSEDGSWT